MLMANQLIGFGVGQAVTSISVFDSATASDTNITAPAGIIRGDLFILLDRAVDGSFPTTVIPSGFSSWANQTFNAGGGNLYRVILSYKIAIGNEGSSSLTGMSPEGTKALYVFRGNAPITRAFPSLANSEATSGNPSPQTVTTTSGGTPSIVIGSYVCSFAGAVNPRTMTPAKDGEISANPAVFLAYKIYNSNQEDVSVDMDDESDANILQSGYISVS